MAGASTAVSADTLKQKERNARLYVFAGKPALAGTTSRDVARAGTLRRTRVQRLSNRGDRSRPGDGRFAARSRFYRGGQSLEHRPRTGQGWRKNPVRG